MKRQRRGSTPKAVQIDPELERRWEEALRTRPSNNDPEALAAWNEEHGELLAAYQAAVERAQKRQRDEATARTRRRRTIAIIAISVLLAIGGIVYWTSRPSEDEIRSAQMDREAAACNVHYQQTHHLKMVDAQIDLLKDGEGGWLELRTYGQPANVGNVTLSPAELLAGKTGEAQVNREAYVWDSPRYVGAWALVERQNGRLILTLLALQGFGELPHAPLQVGTASAVTVRGEEVSRSCF